MCYEVLEELQTMDADISLGPTSYLCTRCVDRHIRQDPES